MNMRIKGIKQQNIEDCGAACLATILKIYHSEVSLHEISEKLQVDCGGATIYGIIEVGKQYGLLGEALEGSFDELLSEVKNKNIKFPIIAHVIKENILEHYIVIRNIDKNKIQVFDPDIGNINYDLVKFQNIWTGYIITFSRSNSFKYEKKKRNYLKKGIEFIKPLKKWIIGIFLLSIIISVISIIAAYVYQYVIDYCILGISNLKNIKNYDITDKIITSILKHPETLFMVLISLYLFQNVITFIKEKCVIYYTKNIAEKLANPFYKKLFTLPISFFQNKKTGEIISRFQDIENTKKFLAEDVITGVINTFMALIGGIALINISVILFSIVCITLVIYVVIIVLFLKPIKKISKNTMDSYSEMMSELKENVDAIEIIKSHKMEKEKTKKILNSNKKFINVEFEGSILWNKLSVLITLVEQIGMIVNLWIGAKLIFNNNISLGEFLAFESLTYYFTEPLKGLITLQMEIQKCFVSLQRVDSIMKTSEENDLYQKEDFDIKNCDIELKNVSFSYGYRENILTDINLKIRRGEKIAIAGKSGSGKSTLAKLISSFYYVNEGKILIDGKDIKKINIDTIRNHIIYIPQSIKLFSGTLRENLILNSTIDEKKIEKVKNGCLLNEIIEDEYMGMDAIISEEGKNLSGGQRQRIAIAQALLKNPDVLILDESTNQLDFQTERDIINFILNEYENCTCIFISHSKNIWNYCERKIELIQGKYIREEIK